MEECKFQINDSYVHYIKAGNSKKNLVLISGISLTGFEGFGASIARQYNIFLDEYTLYCFDRRKNITSSISLSDLAEDTYKALQYENVSHADFIGFSQGGMICMQMALDHPDMVDSLILGSSAAAPGETMRKTGEKWLKYLNTNDVYNFNLEFYRSIYSPRYFEKHRRAFDRMAHIGTADECRRFEWLLDSMDKMDLLPRLCEIKCPCYVIASEKDETLGAEASLKMSQALGCECYIYPDGSHSVFDEDRHYTQMLYEIEKSLKE